MKKAKRKSTSSIFSKMDYSVCKCALVSERMADALVKFYNIIIEFNYYPERWMKIVDAVAEKGKGQRIKKLRVLKITKVDMHLLMRMFLGSRMNNKIEEDKGMSKCNHGSRKGYSTVTVFLEKRLIFDYAKKNEDVNVCTMSYLEASYDRHMAELCGVAEEKFGSNRKVVKLTTKVLLAWSIMQGQLME